MRGNGKYSLTFALVVLLKGVVAYAHQTDSSIFSKPLNIEATVKTERVARSEQKGDTLIFNAAAYQVAENADSERLISKMPGISVSDSGVDANGKEVARILLDGQEFFGNDVLTALRNVPADMVKQIEVINKLSDAAQLVGIDDGEGYTALNIVTKRKKGSGLTTGRIYGSYGLSDDVSHKHNYIAGGNVSHFTDKRSISVIGMSNNISKFNFTSSDIISGSTGLDAAGGSTFKVKALSGLSDVHSLGVNYTSDKCNLTYFFNDISNYNRPVSDKVSTTSIEDRMLLTHSQTSSDAHNSTHKLTGKITLSPSGRHSLIIRPNITIEDMSNGKDQFGHYKYIYSSADDVFVRKQLNIGDNDRWMIRAGADLTYRYKFEKRRRNLSIGGKYNIYSYSALDRSWEYRWSRADADTTDLSDPYNVQNRERINLQHSASARLTYSEPIAKRSLLSAEYVFSMTDTRAENLVFPCKDGVYAEEPVERTSAINHNVFYHNKAGLRYNYWRKKLTIAATASYQHTLFDGSTTLPAVGHTRRVYHHPMYNIVANLPFNKSNKLRIEARNRIQTPGVYMLQNIVDRSTSSNVRGGNPNISPANLHTADIQYINTNRRAGTTFSITLSYTTSANYFCDSLVINNEKEKLQISSNGETVVLSEGQQFVKPINLSGYHNLMFKSAFAMPIDFLRCNFNVGVQASIQRLPGLINGDYVPINRNWYQLSGRLDSNISKNIDFTIGYLARYSVNEYTGKIMRDGRYTPYKVTNNNITHRVSCQMKCVFLKYYTFTGAFIYRQLSSTRDLYDDRYYYCDLFLGRKFLKSKRLEVSIGVNDLFDDNKKSIWHTVNASGRLDGYSIGIGRYFSLQCIWHFRSGTKPKKIINHE